MITCRAPRTAALHSLDIADSARVLAAQALHGGLVSGVTIIVGQGVADSRSLAGSVCTAGGSDNALVAGRVLAPDGVFYGLGGGVDSIHDCGVLCVFL
jgi:hypothetical protein